LATPIDTKSNGGFAICKNQHTQLLMLLADWQSWIYQNNLEPNTGTKQY